MSIRNFIRCTNCNNLPQKEEAKNILENESFLVVHLACTKCASNSLYFTSGEEGISLAMGMPIDMNLEETIAHFFLGAIKADEVLDIYNLTSGNKALLKENKEKEKSELFYQKQKNHFLSLK